MRSKFIVLAIGGTLLAGCQPASTVEAPSQGSTAPTPDEAAPDFTELDNAIAEKTDALVARRARSTNFKNGILVPLGTPLAEFKTSTLMDCSGPPTDTICTVVDTNPLDCPSERLRIDVSYWFGLTGLNGFSAGFDEDEWQRMKDQTSKLYGPGTFRQDQLGPMLAEQWVWSFDVGSLTLARYSGTDLNGSPVHRPHTVVFSGSPSK